ncbi:MAG: hypothetical protein U0840_27220 [Gemmataceae bacterium]
MRAFPHLLVAGCIALFVLLFLATETSRGSEPPRGWYEVDAKKNVTINVYVFWSKTCGRCPRAIEYLRDLEQRTPWMRIVWYEVSEHPGNRQLYQDMATGLGRVAGQVPAIFFCKDLQIGFDGADVTGPRIERALKRWYDALTEHYKKRAQNERGRSAGLALLFLPTLALMDVDPPLPPEGLPIDLPPEEPGVTLPLLGEVQASNLSLPAFTLLLAACDAFNPCAFFVLLFLLGILLHSNSRPKMLFIGGTFVFFSGLVYFLFMAAWLNLFFILGHLRVITVVAALVALAVALLNIKDFFWFKEGVSLAIPEAARPSLIGRARALVHQTSWWSMVAGTMVLATLVNLYELLCTSGFPMVFTRVLTLRELPTSTYYLYLLLYNLIYILPLACIVAGFSLTLGGHKLTEYEGRVLKLLSGMMMLLLGVVLLVRPEVMNTLSIAVMMLLGAVGLTALIVVVDRYLHRSSSTLRIQ